MPYPVRRHPWPGWLATPAIVGALSITLVTGCTAGGTSSGTPGGGLRTSPAARTSPTPGPVPTATDPPTTAALLHIAQVFNNEYDNGDFGAVYDRWDARSRALISRTEYIRRHLMCAPATHAVAQVESAVKGAHGAWLVSYRIGGVNDVDTWYYAGHRWVFDIVASNPSSARQYAMPFQQYAHAVGCTSQ